MIACLGLGIALCITTIAVVNAYVLRSLPYPASDRLYQIGYGLEGERAPEDLEAIDWTALGDVVELALAADPDVLYLTSGGYTEQAPSALVTTGYLEGLGVRPALGRSFRASDAVDAADRVAIISHRLWRDRFGSDANILGRHFSAYSAEDERATFTLTVVGVLPADFWSTRATDIMLPLRDGVVTTYAVRLRPGVKVAAAEQRMSEHVRAVAGSVPATWSGVHLQSVHDRYVEGVRPMLAAITVAAGLVLLIVCANVSVLNLLRATSRQKEVTLRVALGAGRARVVRMLIVESCLLSAGAIVLALGLSALSVRALAPVIEQNLGRAVPGGVTAMSIDRTVLLSVAGLGLVVAMLLSLAPVLVSWRQNLFATLRRDGTDGVGSLTGRRVRSLLTAAEVAGSVALLIGCGLMIRTVRHLSHTDLGMQLASVESARITLPAQPYSTPAARAEFYDRLLERLDPSTALSDWPLLAAPLQHPLEADDASTAGLRAGAMAVTGQFFDTLGIRIVAGRGFTTVDRLGTEPVAVISESLARRLWPAGNAVGRRIRTAEDVSVRAPLGVWRRVVGVVADVRQTVTDEDLRDIYLPFAQLPNRFTSVVFRADGPASTWLGAFRAAVAAVNPLVAAADSPSPETTAHGQLAGPRFLASLLSGFAAFTAVLAVLGLYGVVTYGMQQREREIAIRIALGATAADVTRMLVRHGARLLCVGLVVGLLVARVVGRLLQSELHGVQSSDPVTIITTCALIGAAGLLATWWPARRAAVGNPVGALKTE